MKLPEFNKRNGIILALSIVFAVVMSHNAWHIQTILSESLLVILASLLTALIIILIIKAGLVVIESLLLLGGEISLVIFLAQSYCAPEVKQTITSDHAVNSFIILALAYIAYLFFQKIYDKVIEQGKQLKALDGKWSWQAIFMLLFLLMFVGVFMYMIYLVISPTISALCIYHR